MSELEKLEDLYNMGFICEEEFIRRKEELGISTPTPSDGGSFNPVAQHDPFSFPQPEPEPYNPYAIPTQEEPAYDPFAIPQPTDASFSLSQSLSRSMNLSHSLGSSHSEPHSLANSSSNPLANSQKRTSASASGEALPGETAYQVHDENLRGYVFYQLTRWGSQQTPVVYGNLTLPEIAKTLETKSNIYVESIFDPTIKFSDPEKPVPHGQYYVKEKKNADFTQPTQPAHWMRNYLDLCFREFTVYFEKGEHYNSKKHKVFCVSQTYRILFCFPSGVEAHTVAKALGRRHYRLIESQKFTGWTDGVHMIGIEPVKHDDSRPLSYQELLHSVPGQNYDARHDDPDRPFHVSVMTLRNEFVNFYRTNDTRKIMKSLCATGTLLYGLQAHTANPNSNFKKGPINPNEVPQLPNGVYRLVISPKGLGFQNSSTPIYHQCLDYDKHMGECYFTRALKKSEMKKRPIPPIRSGSADEKLVPIGTKVHFVLRVRELQRMHLGEANDFEANSLMKTSLDRRLEEKLCVVSGQPLNDGALVSNYHDELLEQLYKNLQTKEPVPKLFPEKEIGEVDDKEVFAGQNYCNDAENPGGGQPWFCMDEWLSHEGRQWKKEDTWDEFEANGRKFDYTLMSPQSAIAQLSKKTGSQWMAKLFENPHQPISD